MVTLRGRNDPLRLMGRRLLLALLAVLVLGAVWGVWNTYRKERESARLNADAQTQLADLTARQAKLQNDLKELQSNRGMEAAVRGEYSMGAPGEGMIVIVEPPQPAPLQATSSIMQWIKDVLSHL